MSSACVIPSLGPEKSQHLWELIKAKLASLNLYTDDVLSEYIMVLLNAGNDRQKLFEELVIFMNSPEVAEHFVIWLFEEVERLQQVVPVPVTAQVQEKDTQITTTVVAESTLIQDVHMGSGTRLQGTRNFSKALEGAVSNSRRTFSEERERDRESIDRNMNESSHRRDQDYRSNPRNSPTRSARRVIRSSAEDGGKIQKIKLSVDFDRDTQRHSRRINQKNNFKKISDNEEEESSTNPVIKVKCQYWPNCRAGDSCPNVHPSETCRNFPNCQFGDSCTFVHPSIPCKFQEKCQNPLCNYQHRPMALGNFAAVSNNPSLSTIQCKFYPRCVNINCPYLHPVKVQCRYGVDCSRPDCPFEHPSGRKGAHLKSVIFAPCKYGKQCARADCPYQHDRSDAPPTTETTDAVMDMSSSTPTDPQVLQ